MPLKLIVLAKQVPDTHNVTVDAMKADGTVNRGALPAIFNPEDLNGETLEWDGDSFLSLQKQIPCKPFRGFRYKWW